ncbi:hypothetical protein K431DRAFT_308504 [Polychaeton citri CBS 116435]|uniref:Uncharacterized protein n=1 Tax=Polychaeton citri CBS 116435 TaxID=1314669 RepID=A0A9P4QJJ0_9PEZI|nr:hypothetical protein K431DRAFT_308504 [Polychaeton citri CBS 116435]
MRSLRCSDWKALRLVNTEFEWLAAVNVFHTLAVPPNGKLYRMLKSSGTNCNTTASLSDPSVDCSSQCDKAIEDRTETANRTKTPTIFERFGDYICRFGMTFELREEHLKQPLQKKDDNSNMTYHGQFQWPSKHYVRNAELESLEEHTNDPGLLKYAFKHLSQVNQLALRTDNGLGWLSGPDKSIKSRIFAEPEPVFKYGEQSQSQTKALQTQFWDMLNKTHEGLQPHRSSLQDTILVQRPVYQSFDKLATYLGPRYSDISTWLQAPPNQELVESNLQDIASEISVIYAIGHTTACLINSEVTLEPAQPTSDQLERLLETSWAQKGFI